MTKTSPKAKRAWAVVNVTFRPTHPYLAEVYFKADRAHENAKGCYGELKVIPCTISFHLPSKKRGGNV